MAVAVTLPHGLELVL